MAQKTQNKWENFTTAEKVDFKDGWDSERDFDDWLVSPGGLALLFKVINVEIDDETIRQQEGVGGFSADIYAKDIDGKIVVIENQRDKTDHDHLGKILTYAGGLTTDATGCHLIWIAEKIRDEHRAALDWLNSRTGSENSFFGLEMSVQKIGQHLIPDLKVVCAPNNWVRTEQKKASGALSPVQTMRLEFWGKLLEEFHKRNLFSNRNQPTTDSWFGIGAGVSRCEWNLHLLANQARVTLYLNHPQKDVNKFLFDELSKNKDKIEEVFEKPLLWELSDETLYSRIMFEQDFDCFNPDKWDEIIKWMAENTQRLQEAARQPLLDAKKAWDNQ